LEFQWELLVRNDLEARTADQNLHKAEKVDSSLLRVYLRSFGWSLWRYSLTNADSALQGFGTFLNGLFKIAMNLSVPSETGVRNLRKGVSFFSLHVRDAARWRPKKLRGR